MATKRLFPVSKSLSPTAVVAVLMSLVAVGVTTSTQSISLANFTPRIENLPTSCQNVYVTSIDGCNKDDFTTSAGCSSKCVQGLLKISQSVNSACKGVDVPETSIIGVFMLGKGVQALCPGVEVTTVSSISSTATTSSTTTSARPASTTTSSQARTTSTSSSTAAAASTSSSVQSTTTSSSSSSAATTTSSSETTSSQTTLASSTTTSILAIDTNTSPAAATSTSNSQQANTNAGIGSPFDIGVTAGASRIGVRDVGIAMMGMLAMMFGAGLVL